MKIAFFTNTILEHGGGLEKYFIETAVALAEHHPESEIIIVTFDERRTEILQRLLSVYYLKEMPIQNIYREKTVDILKKLGRVRYIKCPTFIQAKSELKKADIIYSKNEIVDLSILKCFGYKGLPPIVTGIHTPIFYPVAFSFHSKLHNFLYNGFLYKFLLKGLSGVHVTNQSNMELVQKMGFSGIVTKVSNPFSFPDTPVIQDHSKNLNVLFVGRINREKGVDLFMDCIRSLAQENNFSRYQFKIAGSGDTSFIEKIETLSKEYTNVLYVGHVPNTEIHTLYNWADVVLVPSHFETASYVILETGAHGKIALASDIPGPRDLIENGKTGYLLPLRVEFFVEKLKELFRLKEERPEIFSALGARAREHVHASFDPEVLYELFYEMLEKSLRNKGKI